MSKSIQNIEFKTVDHVVLRGFFYKAAQAGPRPCIIMAPGIGGLKEQFLPDFAERFQEAGYGVLLYDHRNFGSSEGSLRDEVDPNQQARDYSDAFDFAASLPDVDESRIVFWGSSMSGGVAIYAAAFDKRIRAVVVQVPFASGAALEGPFAKILPGVYEDRRSIKAGAAPGLTQIFAQNSKDAKDPNCTSLTADPALIPFIEELENRKIRWEGAITTQSIQHLVSFEPVSVVHRISPTPLLVVAADRDHTSATAQQLKLYAAALEPKELVLLQNTDHFMPYVGATFKKNIKAQLDFLAKVLRDDEVEL
ncbi:uncharacterized protein EAF01_009778 [Botrytis porri]|uniref:Serine aminopeptidase S33 domain-containing protein n=1 Tax=Botrytis porri TaxID=87229 RepID=A0A4Z1KIJ3_9HELO|nr:uncharacterized protein EAF01_009778 [Botrytis porri]KAF7895816.1 hypothetical protein EAF01_009778 [Botrytis porri]TGO80983.1 hypothetical protein BPOR_1458g00010 [Botrytis porri]